MLTNFYSRWGISRPDNEMWQEFINRLLNIIVGNSSKLEVPPHVVISIAFSLGRRPADISTKSRRLSGETYLMIEDLIGAYMSPYQVAKSLEAILPHLEPKTTQLIVTLCELSNASGFRIKKKEDQWVSYPLGEKLLDKETVEKPLSYLDGKPADEFLEALRRYSEHKYVEAAEKSRRTLEEFLRQILKRDLGLTPAIQEYGKKMKKDGVPEHLRNLINRNLRSLDDHYNESSKHQSKTGEAEAEYLIYSVGAVLNIINGIAKTEDS